MSPINPQTVLSSIALVILGALGGAMLFEPVPSANATALTFILGALAGALTMQSGNTPKPPAAA
jgi:hypothetical protein